MRRVVALVVVGMLTAMPVLAAEGRITVTGTGSVQAAPDMAVISLGVTSEAREAVAAMAATSDAAGRVLARLREAGIEARDLQSDALSLSPVWRQMQPDGSGQPQITGYMASNSLSVRVRELDRLGEILDLAMSDGANTLGGLQFGIEERAPLSDDAMRRAVADARRKAGILASEAGVTLGPVVSISEAVAGGPEYPMARMEAAMGSGVPVAAGELSVAVSVTVEFAIAD